MSGPFGSSQWMYNAGGVFYGYEIDGSLRFNDDDSAYLQRTAGTPTNNKIWTLSCWVKLANLATARTIFNGFSSTAAFDQIIFNSSNQFFMQFNNSGTYGQFTSNQVFRDVSGWGHLVVKADTTAGSNGVTAYWNGDVISGTWNVTLASNATFASINASGDAQRLGLLDTGVAAQYFDGYLADVYFVDGTALDATSFGETKSGVWIPKAYSGSYGTNGFHLEFAGNANDTSGNGNNFTANNISSYDYVPDSPTLNWSTLNRNAVQQNGNVLTFSEGNLKVSNSGSDRATLSTFGMSSGKWYFEAYVTGGSNDHWIGVWKNGEKLNGFGAISQTTSSGSGLACVYQGNGGGVGYNGSTQYTGSSYTGGDYIGCCFDADNGKVYFHKNGTWQNSADPSAGTGGVSVSDGEWLFYIAANNSGQGWIANFGQDSTFAGTTTAGGNADENGYGDFKYAVETGFVSLVSANLPDPAIDPAQGESPADYFNTVLYTGANPNAAQSVTGVGFQPDFLWIKSRVTGYGHALQDVVRGATGRLQSDTTGAESVSSTYVSSFDSDGFSLGVDYGQNAPSEPYAAWNWKAGGAAVSNTEGSITSSVSANTDAGFSVCAYTGDNASGASTVGHGLGVAPNMVIIKRRDTTGDWIVGHDGLATNAFANNKFLKLESSSATFTNSLVWGSQPTSTVVQITTGSGAGNLNASGGTYVMYSFADVDGYSKAGSYVGNGSSDGSFIYTGFRPAWVMIKRTDTSNSATDWFIFDTKRFVYNDIGGDEFLEANKSGAEQTALDLDILSNGFKLRDSSQAWNASGGSYIYMAFAENPFKYANAR